MDTRPIEALAALESHLRTLRRTNTARLLATPEQIAESLDRFVLIQGAIEAVQRATRDEHAANATALASTDRKDG